MNDRPSSGQYPDFGYDGLSTTTFAGDSAFTRYETQDQGYNYGSTYGSYDTGSYDTTAWTAPQNDYAQPSADGYAGYAAPDGYLSTVPTQGGVSLDYQSTAFGYDTSAEQTGHWSVPGYGTETGTYDATAWNTATEQTYGYSGGYEQQAPEPTQDQPQAQAHAHGYEQQYAYDYGYEAYATAPSSPEAEVEAETAYTETAVFEFLPAGADAHGDVETDDTDADLARNLDLDLDLDPDSQVHDLPTQTMPVTPAGPRPSRRAGSKPASKPVAKASTAKAGASNRRRTPAKRSALLTVAVPSACVMGVAGVAAASVGGLTGTEKPSEETTTLAAPDPASIKPVAANSKLDTQLTALSADAGDFADRASRTQERIDLRLRQDEEKKRKAEEAAAKEAARPKFALPVARHGLSAGFGQAGVNWMSVHTGIDFPVSYGTSVMAATDGTVRSQWNSAYGNMVILTAADGTETWYCHLSSAKIRSGKVKAGDVIAYSGNSGNSTGPHLHFEVRPGGGSPVDPQAWLRAKGLNPN
ncbi:peptidoglycan DD-metalloendopeptidase family protein [Streptomyces sp. NBC_01264]|nr:peptidoglycan DD-metalloendopeptidase family protein [Streptomyces sp. NBC_01264]MCX4780533.1 peptidoglycan DD-metalloendopeptidase family protein [Streptomyces sp. NBC_01264]